MKISRPFLIAGAAALLCVFGVAADFLASPVSRPDARAAERMQVLNALREEDRTKLETYKVTEGKGKTGVQIPIERAMELTVPELNKQKPHPAASVTVP